jgi:hypothetical protein
MSDAVPSKEMLCLVIACDEPAISDGPLCEKHQYLLPVMGSVESISREHVEREDCWCSPTLDLVTDDGRKVWVHHEPT